MLHSINEILNNEQNQKNKERRVFFLWSMNEVFTFLRFAHFQLQEFTWISMKTWSLIELCAEFSAISGFIFFLFRPVFYFIFAQTYRPCFPVFLLTEMSMQWLFRKSCAEFRQPDKPNSYFSFLFFVLFNYIFQSVTRVDFVYLYSAN